MKFRRHAHWLLAVAGLLAAGAIFFPRFVAAEEDKTPDMEKLFREGVDLYQRGRYAEAQAKLKQLHALDPRKDLAARLIEEAGASTLAKMMADTKMGNEPTYLWQYYRQYQIKKMADTPRMAKMAQRLVDPATTEDERALLYREFSELGHYAVPLLAPYLKDATHEDFRTYARTAIAGMGARAVLPVIQLVGHKDALMRENAMWLLHDIQPLDPRAIPALKARLEDDKETRAVKDVAAHVLKRICGLPPAELRSAADCYFDAANRYYLERAGVAEEAEDVDGMVWHLNEQNDLVAARLHDLPPTGEVAHPNEQGFLVAVQYPLWAWNGQMAEELVLRGLAANPEHPGLLPLWACVLAAQYTEVKDLLDMLGETPAQHNYSAEEKKDVENWDKKLVDVRRLVAVVGKVNCNAALNKTLADLRKYPGHTRLPQVAVFLAKELAALDPRGELLTPPPDVVVEVKPGKDPTIVSSTTPLVIQTDSAIVRAKVRANVIEICPGPVAAPAAQPPKDKEADKEGKDKNQDKEKNNDKDKDRDKEGKDKESKDKVEPAQAPAVVVPVEPAPVAVPVPVSSASGLVNGLDSSEESVQYACALSLAAINRYPSRWLGSDKVARILARGISENKALQILLVEENHNASNEMRQKLEALGYGVSAAISGRDAVMQGRSFPPKDIAIIADVLRRDLNTEQVLEELKADVRTRYLPVGILHERKDRTSIQSRFGTEACLVEREVSGNDLKTAVDAVAAKRAAESVPKRKADEVAVACATALSKVDPHGTWLLLGDAVKNSLDALFNRKDDVRNPAAIFLGRVEGGNLKQEAGDKLKAVVLDEKNPVELRRNALRSLGLVVKEGPSEDVYRKLQADPDQELKDLYAEAFGQGSRANKAVIEYIRTERIEKEKKEK